MALFRVANERAQFDAASNDARDQYGAGIRFTQEGNARVTTSAGTFYNQGIPMSGTGQVAIVDATAGLPSGTIYHNGLPMSGDKVCVSKNATAVVSNGLPFDSAGALAADINFDLNFIGTDTLNSSVTFTRASTGTFFNSAGVLTSAAINAPRFDYNPTTLAARGLLIEEARTNGIRNNTMQGAVAGTPGTLPTNWNVSGLGTLTQQVVGTGTVNGITYIDIRFSGTTSTTQLAIRFEPNGTGGIPAANGQTWAASQWSAVIAGSLSNITGSGINANLWDAAGSFVGGALLVPINTTATLTRLSGAGTIATAGTAFIQPQIYLTFSSGAAIDITLRIGLPQLEQGAFATSVIPTTTTALTRSADVASVNTLSPWYNASASTIYGEWTNIAATMPSGSVQTVSNINDTTGNNQQSLFQIQAASSKASANMFSGGVNAGRLDAGGAYSNATVKAAAAYAALDRAISVNGGSAVTSAVGALPTSVTRLELGSAFLANHLNGYLRRITYYPRRLSNAELVSITS